jgi:hypothetical protein
MSESGRLDEVARELYGAPPGEFVAARDEHVRQAKAAGDRALASALRALRRPTQSAWLVNQLVRQRRALVDELIEVGAEFRGERLTRQRLHELSERRRELLHRLQAEAQRLGAEAGVPLSADRAGEVEATLAAAVADSDLAEQVRGGRLSTALSYSGLGPELQLAPDAAPPPAPSPVSAGAGADEAAVPADGEPARRSTAGPARGDARRAAEAIQPTDSKTPANGGGAPGGPAELAGQEPDEAARPARAELPAAARRRRDELRERRDELAQRRDMLQAQLQGVRRELAETERELRNAERDVKARSF